VFGDTFDLELILQLLVNNGIHALDHKVLAMPELHQPEKCLELGLLVRILEWLGRRQVLEDSEVRKTDVAPI
jgi:hypothetical protein